MAIQAEPNTAGYDVVIVGAGPAGIFAALELVRLGVTDVLVLEKGKGIDQRSCPARQHGCIHCATCAIMTGWGGAGAFSDGKLTLTSQVGGWLSDYVDPDPLDELLDYADRLWLAYGATEEVHGPDAPTAERLVAEAREADMTLVPMRVRHLGTERSPLVLAAMRASLEAAGVTVRTGAPVASIDQTAGVVTGVTLADSTRVPARAVIAAPGREGADWLTAQARVLDLDLVNNAVDIGVRVECEARIMEPLTDPLYEAKLLYRTPTFKDDVRTFCMNPYGEVTCEAYGDIVTVNGHSFADSRT